MDGEERRLVLSSMELVRRSWSTAVSEGGSLGTTLKLKAPVLSAGAFLVSEVPRRSSKSEDGHLLWGRARSGADFKRFDGACPP